MPDAPRVSIIVPAHDEAALIGRALSSVERAIGATGAEAEIVVVANRCTDRTETIALALRRAWVFVRPGASFGRTGCELRRGAHVLGRRPRRRVMYWVRRREFDAIGGFDEGRWVAEDLDFAYRLRRHGHRTGRRFTNLRGVPVTVCCRKFDAFGDWHIFTLAKRGRSVIGSIKGTDLTFADEYFYDFDRFSHNVRRP